MFATLLRNDPFCYHPTLRNVTDPSCCVVGDEFIWVLHDTNSLISRDLQMVAMPDRNIVNSGSAHNLKSCKPLRPGVLLSGE